MAEKPIDCDFTKLATCPYCGHVERDSWEINHGEEGTTTADCGSCEREYTVTRNVSVTYSTKKLPEDAPHA